jgi:hypothetical protein
MTAKTPLPVAPARSGFPMLALIASLLALPFVIAVGLYLIGWQPARTSNHGTLLKPPQPLPASGLLTSDGQPLATSALHGKWLLILAGRGACDAACSRRIDEMRRIQVSLNKEMGRLRRVVLTNATSDSTLRNFHQQQPDLLLAAAPDLWLPCEQKPEDGSAYRLYVADPQGKLIISYAPDVAGTGVRADLERLLKYSWTG